MTVFAPRAQAIQGGHGIPDEVAVTQAAALLQIGGLTRRLPACRQISDKRSVPALRGHGRHSVRISTWTSHGKRSDLARKSPGPDRARSVALVCS